MIYQIIDLPPNMIGFKASWEVRENDFEDVVTPCVRKHVEKMGQVNFMLVLNTSITDFTFCAWLKDVLKVLKDIAGWKRAAVVSDSKGIIKFTRIFCFFIPDGFRIFSHSEMQDAIEWVSEKDQQKTHGYKKGKLIYDQPKNNAGQYKSR